MGSQGRLVAVIRQKNTIQYQKMEITKNELLVGNGICTLESSSVRVTDKFTIQNLGRGVGHLFGSISIEKQTSNSI